MSDVEQVRRRHAAANPRASNPAWWNCHHDCTVLLNEIARQSALLAEAREALVDLLKADDWLHAVLDEDEDILRSVGKFHRDTYSAWNWANWSGARGKARAVLAKLEKAGG